MHTYRYIHIYIYIYIYETAPFEGIHIQDVAQRCPRSPIFLSLAAAGTFPSLNEVPNGAPELQNGNWKIANGAPRSEKESRRSKVDPKNVAPSI